MTRSDPQKVALWRQRLREFPKSGLTIAQFCAREGVSIPSFYQWRKKLADSPPPDSGPRQSPATLPAFQPVAVAPTSVLTIHLSNGTRIDVPTANLDVVHTVLDQILRYEETFSGGPSC